MQAELAGDQFARGQWLFELEAAPWPSAGARTKVRYAAKQLGEAVARGAKQQIKDKWFKVLWSALQKGAGQAFRICKPRAGAGELPGGIPRALGKEK